MRVPSHDAGFRVLYEDNHLLAADKPAGSLTQPTPDESDALEDVARAYVRQTRHKPGNVFLHAAHRLDREVSGIVLFACTSKALSRLNEQQRSHEWQKQYVAWVQGAPAQTRLVLTHWLVHGNHRAVLSTAGREGARECRLEVEVRRREAGRSLVALCLDTGRYHQIRAQLAAVGCPILGDAKYGARLPWTAPGIALRHVRLALPHPVRLTPLVIEAPDPAFL